MTIRVLFKPCATCVTGTSPVFGWGFVAGDKTGGEDVFILKRAVNAKTPRRKGARNRETARERQV
jgi:hypothetical protein